MKRRTNYAAVAACLGGLGVVLCAIGVVFLATGASPLIAGIALVAGVTLSFAMGISLGLAVRRPRT